MKRREFITLLGGAVVSGPRARAQQRPGRRSGFSISRLPDAITDRLRGISPGPKRRRLRGRRERGNRLYASPRIEMTGCRSLQPIWFSRGVAVIATAGSPSTFAAKAATTDDPSCLPNRRRPGAAWVGDEPLATGRPPHRN